MKKEEIEKLDFLFIPQADVQTECTKAWERFYDTLPFSRNVKITYKRGNRSYSFVIKKKENHDMVLIGQHHVIGNKNQ